MTPQQEKKLRRLAKALDNKEIGVLEVLDEVEAKLEQDIETIYAVVQEALAIAEQTKKMEGKKGDAGYTPVKNKDYFDGKDGYTPIKGVDYVDGKDGRTPIFIGNKEPRNPQKGDLWYRD